MLRKIVAVSALVLLFSACEKQNKDQVKDVDKSGSVEVKVHITHLNEDSDVMRTEKIFWVKGQQVKSVVDLDTVPALGNIREVAENSAGEDTTVSIKKNYQIFITVK